MEKDLSNSIKSELLVAYFRGETTEEQDATIDSWISESAQNQQVLAELKLIWVDTGLVSQDAIIQTKSYDPDKAWNKIKLTPRHQSEGFFYLSTKRLALAASLVLALVCIYLFIDEPPIQRFAEAQNQSVEQLLPDSSHVVLNKNSKLAYTETFAGKERRVKLEGQAFFDITPNKEKPFIIEAANTLVQVVGTSFDVKVDEKTVTVIVETGEVLFGKDQKMLSLKPGEKGVFDIHTQELSYFTETSPVGEEQFWRTKSLNFNGQSLMSIVRTLEEVYATKIILSNDALKTCRLNVSFDNDSIENIMEIISLALSLEVSYQTDSITLTGSGCQQE